jgi:two-component system response regulator GlrR
VDPNALELPTPRSRPRLEWTDAAGTHSLELVEARTAGSAPGCDLILADRAVSRLHLSLVPRDDGLWVKDLGSRNGTFVSGVKVVEARVPGGAVIRVGTTDITVGYAAPAPPEGLYPEASLGSLLGRTAVMREAFATLTRIATLDSSVLFVGESGTGKGAFARTLHDLSGRAGAPFIVVDCAGLPEPLAAAELLEDALQQAEGGTLVLDEPAELSIALQRELVPPIEAKAFRAIATTTRDLRPLVNQGAFREGLYFRLAGTTVSVPPLRERTADLPLLFRHFLGDRADLATVALLDDLARLPWPGNVRELRQHADRIRESGGSLSLVPEPPDPDSEAIPTFDTTMEAPTLDVAGDTPSLPPIPKALERWFETGFKEFREKWIDLGEREYLRRLMKRTNRSSSAASRDAGLERTYLYRLLKKHGV